MAIPNAAQVSNDVGYQYRSGNGFNSPVSSPNFRNQFEHTKRSQKTPAAATSGPPGASRQIPASHAPSRPSNRQRRQPSNGANTPRAQEGEQLSKQVLEIQTRLLSLCDYDRNSFLQGETRAL
jgi:hypothetical protein